MFVPRLQMYLASEQAWMDPGVFRLGWCLNQQPNAGSELVGWGLISLFCVRPLAVRTVGVRPHSPIASHNDAPSSCF